MLARRVFSLSKSLRSLAPLSQANVVYKCERYKHSKANYLPDQSINLDDVHAETSFDTLSVPHKVQNLLDANTSDIRGSDIIAVLKNLSHAYNYKRSSPEKLHSQPFFNDLCSVIKQNLKKLDISDSIEILKSLIHLKVNSDSPLIISLLKHIESVLKDAPMKFFPIVSKSVSRLNHTSETRKIMTNINRTFVIKLNSDFQKNDANFLVAALSYACKNVPSKNIVELLMDSLKNCNLDNIMGDQALELLKVLSILERIPDQWIKILHQTLNKLIDKLHELSMSDIHYLMYVISEKVVQDRNPSFYSSTLFDKIAERVIRDDVRFDDAVLCQTYFNKLYHVHKSMLSYLTAVFYEDREINKTNKLYDFNKVLVLLTGLAYIRYKSIYWDTIHEYLQNGEILKYNSETQLIYCYNLASLDCYNTLVLENVFKIEFRNLPLKSAWTYLRLWQKLQAIPDYDGPQPTPETLKAFDSLQKAVKIFPLSRFLEKALNGPQYFKSNVKSKLYHTFDHVIVYGKNGDEYVPQIIDQDVTYIEDLEVPDGSQVVIVVTLPVSIFTRNTNQILGGVSASYDYLRSRSYKIVAISQKTMSRMSEESGVSYLLNKINSQLSHGSNEPMDHVDN